MILSELFILCCKNTETYASYLLGVNEKLSCRAMLRVVKYFDVTQDHSKSFEMTLE